jgi:segregation and condensation protein B
MTERGEMEAALEAILFVVSEPLPRQKLLELFDEDERALAEEALAAVLARYGGGEARGVMAEEVAGGVRLVTRPEMVGWLRRFFDAAASSKLSMAALETLAIVAYRQPVTAPEIQELRSVNPTGVLKTLLERRLVRIAGRKEVVGKPFLYTTTREFLVHFGLNHLKDLPPLEEFEETFGSAAAALGAVGGPEVVPLPLGEDREERILREAAALEERAEEHEPAESEESDPSGAGEAGDGGASGSGDDGVGGAGAVRAGEAVDDGAGEAGERGAGEAGDDEAGDEHEREPAVAGESER